MKKLILSVFIFLVLFLVSISYAQKKKVASTIKGEEVTYVGEDGVNLKGYVAYNASQKGKRPAIVIVHEWWGSNEYVRERARKLATLGYVAIAVDMYGEGKLATNPTDAQNLATPFYKDPELAKARIMAAIKKVKEYAQTDGNNIAAIGYCFGGSMVLNAAKLGVDFKGVVSFHGGLQGVTAKKDVVKSKILVCHGGNDPFVPEKDVNSFKENLKEVGVPFEFKVYEGATHAFTNPEATAIGQKFKLPIAYNEAADKQSWIDMKAFFKTLF